MKYSGRIAFVLIAVLIITMGFATFIEKKAGSQFVYDHIYYSFGFKLVWLLVCTFGMIHIVYKDLYRFKPVFLFHLSFVVILLGAIITHLTSLNGYIHLREGESQSMVMLSSSHGGIRLPFKLDLDKFEIAYYKGTAQPQDYVSHVNVKDIHSGTEKKEIISMNNILTYKGFRFYQSSFDEDKKGSILSVNRDIYGIPVTYAGYLMLLLSCIWVLIDPKGRFRKLLKHPLLKGSFIILLLSLPLSGHAAETLNENRNTLSKTQASQFGELWMQYNGRICPVQTFASDFTLKITGKKKFEGNNPVQFLAGFLLFPENWVNKPVITIKDKKLAQILQTGEKASYNSFFDAKGTYKLSRYTDQPGLEKEEHSFQKAVRQVHEQVQLIFMIQQGNYMELFPLKGESGHIRWYSPADELPENVSEREKNMVQNTLPMYYLCLTKNEEDLANKFLDRISEFQIENGGESVPGESKKRAELMYNRFNPFEIMFMSNLTIGILALLLFVSSVLRNKKTGNKTLLTVKVVLVFLFVIHTLGLFLRGYISGRLPMSNGYETMLVISWSALFISLCFFKKGILIPALGILLSGFTLLVAHIAMLNPQITPLVPVLVSPLLTLHVAVIMISYALAGFMVLNSLLAFILILFNKTSDTKSLSREYVERLRLLSEVFLYPCVFLLAIGIFVGAVWANVSWGRYWGWDPKEVWALISFLIFSFAFHRRTIPWFRDSFFFHCYNVFAFSSILMTYFGVNYFLGGKHSYAGNSDMSNSYIGIAVAAVIMISIMAVAYKKWKKIKEKTLLTETDDLKDI